MYYILTKADILCCLRVYKTIIHPIGQRAYKLHAHYLFFIFVTSEFDTRLVNTGAYLEFFLL